jgi:hypothetical protein
MTFSWVRSISQWQKRSRNGTTPQIRTNLPDRIITNENKRKAAGSGDVFHSTSRPAHAVNLPSLWWDGQIPTVHRTCSQRYCVNNFWYVAYSRVPSTLLRYGVTVRGNVTRVYPPLFWGPGEVSGYRSWKYVTSVRPPITSILSHFNPFTSFYIMIYLQWWSRNYLSLRRCPQLLEQSLGDSRSHHLVYSVSSDSVRTSAWKEGEPFLTWLLF